MVGPIFYDFREPWPLKRRFLAFFWHFANVKSPVDIEKKLFNFGHHNEVEESGIDLEKIKEMVREKKIYYDHLVDKTQQKHRIEGYELKKLDFSELPSYLIKNYETYKKWFDN